MISVAFFFDMEKFASGFSRAITPEKWRIFELILQHILANMVLIRSGAGDSLHEAIPQDTKQRLRQIAAKMDVDHWLYLWENAKTMLGDSMRIHLDRKQLVLNILQDIQGENIAA